MIDSFIVGQKLILNRNAPQNYYSKSNNVIVVKEIWSDSPTIWVDRVLADESGETLYRGSLNREHFDYYGIHINHEILDLVNRHQVKSFQAILDDGRVIHMSCLN